MNRKRLFFLLSLISTFILSGCWSKKELTDLAIVSAFGVDLDEEGRYRGTLQIINPGNVAGGLQGGGGTQGPPVSVYIGTGDSLVELSRRTSRQLSRRLYYAHTNLVIISEDLARKQPIGDVFDALERDPQFRGTAIIVIAQGSKASDIVKILTPIDKIPANKVIKTLKFTEKQLGENIAVNVQDAIRVLVSPGKELALSGFTLNGDVDKGKKMGTLEETEPSAKIQAGSLAIFKNGKLVGWLEGEEAKGTALVLDKIKGTAIGVNWEGTEEAIVYELIRQKTKVSVKMENDRPSVSITMNAEGNIGEARVPIDFTNPQTLLKIEKELEKEIKKEMNMAIKAAKDKKADIFGFGEALHRSNPEAWKKMKADWNDVYFPTVKTNITVDAFIRRTGLRSKPHVINEK